MDASEARPGPGRSWKGVASLALTGALAGFLAMRPAPPPPPDPGPPPPRPAGTREATAAAELERALTALERLHPGGVGLALSDGDHFRSLGPLIHDSVAPLRLRRLLEALSSWLHARHHPGAPGEPSPLDDPRDPPLLARCLVLLREVHRDFQQGEARLAELAIQQGRLPDASPTYTGEVQAVCQAWIQEQMDAWPRLPDQVARALATLGPHTWSPRMHDLVLLLVERLREVDGERQRRVGETLRQVAYEGARVPVLGNPERRVQAEALEEFLEAHPEAPFAVRLEVRSAALRLRGRLIAVGEGGSRPAFSRHVEAMVGELAPARGRIAPELFGVVTSLGSDLAQELKTDALVRPELERLLPVVGVPLGFLEGG